VRVISGTRKGHKLKSPIKGDSIRPTEDRIKESLFNILGIIKRDSIVLDLFSGSGSIGIEFLSRGAKKCYFVDMSKKSISTIKENLSHTRLLDNAIVIRSDSIKAIQYLGNKNLKFDYIYLDPPFNKHTLLTKAINTIVEYEILSYKGIMIIEHEKQFILDEDLPKFKQIDYRNYGSKSIAFYRWNSNRRDKR